MRNGGGSLPPYDSLNVGDHVGDNPAHVLSNRARLPHSDKIVWLEQVHSNHCVTFPAVERRADASISRSSEFFCAVMTADCVPVLLCNTLGTEVAAVHAGWKGLELEIIASTVRQMESRPEHLMAWVGPAISAGCYEVPLNLARRFEAWPDALVSHPDQGKAWLDLPLIAAIQLQECGISNVVQSNLCTYSNETQFYSHRRAQHQGLTQTGRQVSVIGML
ncbi:peptidoglycan editing factor PgeF [Alteromonas aestuariivivens]|uniref:Purine nucleoside phosphorylase n=2 Tax=Alteromonas aestuariivivens TaxID=1938339 RepID=A0A3D8MFK6_9ALTE|nr:peptidoglycan editing factor PgeF [Alteromonas aestuariivivens]